MELFFCQSPVAQEKSRDLPRMGCLLSVNTFLVTLQQFPQGGVQFCEQLFAVCSLTGSREDLFELVQALVSQMYFTPGCAGGKRVELVSPQHLSRPACAFPGCSSGGGTMGLTLFELLGISEMFHICIAGSKQHSFLLAPLHQIQADSTFYKQDLVTCRQEFVVPCLFYTVQCPAPATVAQPVGDGRGQHAAGSSE